MKIVHTESSCGWGGQEIRILEEARGLIARGHDVSVLCPPEARIYAEAPRFGVPVVALPIARKRLAGLFAVRRYLQQTRPDVVNTHSSTDSWLVALACASLRYVHNAPAIVRTRHISAPVASSASNRWLYGRAARHLVTTGEALRRMLIDDLSLMPQNVTSVPTGIDPARFYPGDKAAAKAALGLDPQRRYIGIVATLRSWKGHLYLLEAFAKLKAPDWTLVIVGEGPMRVNIEPTIAALNLQDRVVLAGQQNAPEDWLRALDIFCLPSYANEGVPQALLQAMLCALPIVTTPVGAILEAVKDGETALVVEPRNADALATAIDRLIRDPLFAAQLGERARAYALENFTQEKMLDAMARIFSAAAMQCTVTSSTATTSTLVINVTRIGDTLLTTPSLRAIAATGGKLTFLGHPKRAEVIQHLPYVTHVGEITKKSAPWRGRFAALCGKPYDLAFVYGFDEALVAYALRVAKRVLAFRQKSESLNRRLYRVVDIATPMSVHAVDLLLDLPAAAGIPAQGRHLDYHVTPDETAWARATLAQTPATNHRPLIGLQVASFPTKAYRDWPLPNFMALADRIRAHYPQAHFLIFGGSEEQERTRSLANTLGNAATCYAGRLTLRQTAALMNEIDLYVGVDTGPTHIMGALHRPMVALYHGYSPSRLLAPLDHPSAYIVDHPLADRGATPQTPMADITVDAVWQAVERALAEHPPRAR